MGEKAFGIAFGGCGILYPKRRQTHLRLMEMRRNCAHEMIHESYSIVVENPERRKTPRLEEYI